MAKKYNNLRNFYLKIYEEEKSKFSSDPKEAKKQLKKLNKKYENLLAEIEKVENFSDDFEDMSLHIEWKKSAAWGDNPHGKLNVSHKKGYSLEHYVNTYKINGCGYCKLSTCTADLLNQSCVIKKVLLDKIDEDMAGSDYSLDLRSLGYGISQYWLD